MTAILMTSGTAERKMIGEFSADLIVESRLGVRAAAREVVLLEFVGVPLNRMQEQTVVTREVAITLPDLWELRNNLDLLIDEAIARGVLEVPR